MMRILTGTAFAVAAGMATPALAELKYENQSGGHVRLYGQFNPAYLTFDDGQDKDSLLVDNQASNSRVGLWVVQPMNSGTFRFNFEASLGLRKSSRFTQGFEPQDINWQRTEIRKIDFSYKTDTYGTFYLGQGSVSSDGAAQVDLSGTGIAGYNGIGDLAGAFRFRRSDGTLSTRTIAQSFANYDGGRRFRVRYDSPELLPGLKLSISHGEDILVDGADLTTTNAAILYGRKVGAFKMKGALAYAEIETGTGVERQDTIGSFSVLHDSGFNATIAAGDRDIAGNYVYGKIGYQANWLSVGQTNIAVDYYDGSDTVVAGSSSSSWGIGVVQKFDKQRLEAYLGYRNYDLSEPGVDYQEASSIVFGTRWKF